MKTIEVNYDGSHKAAIATIDSAYKQGEISRTQAREFTQKANENYKNRNVERVVSKHFNGKLQVREV